ncbi:hypothetical protein LPA44_13215 [Halobacterium sp. KA-4]|uniref:hypothetical protein n=1 Tax=Halobacterium sp. KA-4 TaxID=2896367 RepID=UPI001E5198EE|nr:hypothetical protein [Halobacterium sp. KA-4]MCD2200846.1 hypothetical protein [Halobacterium sp. KA-4]
MSNDGKNQDTDEQTNRSEIIANSRSRGEQEALGGEREIPEDADHVTMAPEHIPTQMQTDDKSSTEDE